MTDHFREATNMHTENSDGSNPELPITMDDEPLVFSDGLYTLVGFIGTCFYWLVGIAGVAGLAGWAFKTFTGV